MTCSLNGVCWVLNKIRTIHVPRITVYFYVPYILQELTRTWGYTSARHTPQASRPKRLPAAGLLPGGVFLLVLHPGLHAPLVLRYLITLYCDTV